MPSPRGTPRDLVRLLNSADEPIYALDAQRRIAFLNAACAGLIGPAADELIGARCDYRTGPPNEGPAALAGAMCPPPAAFAGPQTEGTVVMPSADGTWLARRARFARLGHASGEPAGLLVIVGQSLDDGPSANDVHSDESPEALHASLVRFQRELAGRYAFESLVGVSPAIRRVRAQIELAAAGSANVSIVGPQGSGREHVARAIHYARRPAATARLVPLDCSLLAADLLASTIQALIGSRGRRDEDQSTLLLNEIDSAGADVQSLLVERLAGPASPAVLSTATRPLAALVAEGAFRADLAALLTTLSIELPPLAARLDDLPLLVQAFVEEVNARGGKQVAGFSSEAFDRLAAYAWPGEVAELREVVRQAHSLSVGSAIAPADLPERIDLALHAEAHRRRPETTIVLDEFLGRIERELIERALARAKGNKTTAARLLGMTRPRLYRRLVQLGLEDE